MLQYGTLLLLAAAPIAVSFITALSRGSRPARTALYISLLAHLMSLTLAIYFIAHYLGGTESAAAMESRSLQFHWLQLSTLASNSNDSWINIGAFADARGIAMYLSILIISLLVHLYLLSLLKAPEIRSMFFAWCDLTVLGLLLAILSPNLLQMYACLTVASAGAWYMLNGVWRSSHEPGAWKWMIVLSCSDAFFLAGILIASLHFG